MNRITTVIPKVLPPAKRARGESDYYAIIRAKNLLEEVAAKHRLTVPQIKARTRRIAISWPRQEFMFRAAEANVSYSTIARVAGLSDHSTIIHGIRRHEARQKAANAQV